MSLRALLAGYLEAKRRSLQGFGSIDGFREAFELFAEGRGHHEQAARMIGPGDEYSELTKAYDVLSRAEQEALDIQNMALVSDIQIELDKVGKERAALRKAFSVGFREALELFAEGRGHHEEAAGAADRGIKDAELTKAYDVLSRAEQEALDIQNMPLVRDIRTVRDKVGKERAALRKAFSKKTIRSMSLPETLQIRLLDDLLDAFGRLKDRFTHDRSIATLKDARSLFKFEAFTNLLDSRTSEEERPLTSQEKNAIWSMVPSPSHEDLARFRSEASIRKIQKMVDTIRTHILTLAETNLEMAAHYKRRTEAIASR